MAPVVAFATVLLAGTLISERAHRSVLSTAVLFLVAGMVLGHDALGVLPISTGDPLVAQLAELALFAVLFTDGMKVGVRDLVSAWRLPTRALLLGLPLTFALTTGLAHAVAGLPWLEAGLVGAALSPTDPVLAEAIVGREQIPLRLRRLLNVESGVNDGLVLPVLLVLLALLGERPVQPLAMGARTVGGVALGVALPWLGSWLQRQAVFGAARRYQPLTGLAVGLLVFGVAGLVGANTFLAAFAAGITIATVDPGMRRAFEPFGELVTELLKLAAIMIFGALLWAPFFAAISWRGYAFAALAVLVVRPAALTVALLPVRLPRREWFAAAWFGPKGFASVLYGLVILHSPATDAAEMFRLVGLVVAVSIVVHSSTDALVARWFDPPPDQPGPTAEPQPPADHPTDELEPTQQLELRR